MGLIQIWNKNKMVRGVSAWRYNRRMEKAVAILDKCAPYYLKQIGMNKHGTIYQVKDLSFNMRKKNFEVKMRKLSRGTQTQKHGS
jgi:hypothetical protein